MRIFQAEAASADAYELAEGPVWYAERERLLWVDIPAGKMLCGQLRSTSVEVTCEERFPDAATGVVPTSDDGLLVTLSRRFATGDADGTRRIGQSVLPEAADCRFNDGACDPAGRFLVGSMALDDREGTERLYRLDGGGALDVVDDGLTLSNGLGWSPNGQTFYSIDSVPGIVWSRSYDPGPGALGQRQEHLRFDDGTPDGMCVDTDGNLWVAVWGVGQVRCFNPVGEQIATVEVAAPHTSSVAFVGTARDRLVITTAREDLSAAELDAYPLSGRLFLADVGVRGVPTTAWAGRCTALT